MARYPSTPDCAIRDCVRAAGRHGLCRHHAALIPRSLTLQCQIEVITSAYTIGRKFRRRYIAAVRRALREAAA